MSEKMKNIPKLRFYEFLNEPEWKKIKLEKLVKISSGYSPSNYELKNFGTYPFLKVEDLNNCEKYQFKSRNYSEDKKNIIQKNSIIFPKRGAAILLNKVRINKLEVLMDSNLMAITPSNKINNEFLYYTIDKVKLSRIADTSTIPQINNKHILPFEIFMPTENEQQKIADCLSSIDSLITAQNQKVELLKEHKNGLLQNLFPKDGENVPKFRFPEFINNEVWEDKFLKEVLIKNSLKNKDGKYLLVQSVSNKHGFINQDEYFENRRVASKDTSNYYVIKKGFFAYNPSRIDVGSLAYKFDDEPSIISPLYVSFRANKEKIVDIFLLNWFFSENFTSQMIFEGGVRNTLNYENLIQIKIKLPKNIEEQQKIADFLSSVDEEINLQSQKVETLKEHKKALLQQLFPKSI